MTTRKSNNNNTNVEHTTINQGAGMVVGLVVHYEEYTLMYEGEGVFSCIGNFIINNREQVVKFGKELKHIISNVRDSHMATLRGDDYGPQRFCNVCGVKLDEVYDSMDNQAIFIHPNTDLSCAHDVGVKLEPEEMNTGVTNNEHLTMDELREVYRGLKGADVKWLTTHSEELKELYKKYADDYSPDGDAMCKSLHFITGEDEEIQFSEDDIIDRIDAPLRTNVLTELTTEEQWLRGYASYVLAYNPKKVVIAAVKTKFVRSEIMEDIIYLANCFISAKLVHPKLERRRRNYPTNWKQLQPIIEREERITRRNDLFLTQDWDLESRRHMCRLEHCFA